MKFVKRLLARVDEWQRRSGVVAPAYGVVKKFNDDNMNQYVTALGWYGFVSIYPLLLVAVTVLGFIGVSSLGQGLVETLHHFPVVGAQFNPALPSHNLHGSVFGLIAGLVGLIYGAQGVTQTAQQAMGQVWNVPQIDLPSFIARLLRSFAALGIIGGSFVINAVAATFVTGAGTNFVLRAVLLVAMLVVNVALFLAAFRVLTPGTVTFRGLLPGVCIGALGFTLLITVGSGLIAHEVRNSSATYGQFGVVIGLVGFLFLLAKISLYGAELNPVLARHLWPRALVSSNPTDADKKVLSDIAHEDQRRMDEVIGVGFGVDAPSDAAKDAEGGAEDDETPTT
jgi:YihY family inner membrane protein